jgi:hypothetical protein
VELHRFGDKRTNPYIRLDLTPPEVMTVALAQLDRDEQAWSAWVNGASMEQIAAQRGVHRQAIHAAISRYLASVPAPERDAYRERTLARLEELYQAHRQAALERPRVAAIVRGILDSQARVLGLVQNQVNVQHDGTVEHTWTPGPTVQELLERWMAEGRIRPRVELERTDR